jgi:hypothetical protein
LSDTHFGEEDSLLTNLKTASTDTDPSSPSPVAVHLAECLKHLISRNENSDVKPILILNGDILEMALCETNEAAMAFERFLELVMPPRAKLFDKIVYIPGNHDHHLWESARETQYVNHIKTIKPGRSLPIPWHTTNMFIEEGSIPVPCDFLETLARRHAHLGDLRMLVAYPNLGFFKEEGEKCLIFHHGHFIEPLYTLMSTLRTLIFPNRQLPKNIWDVEAENFAWIDFFWSAMGRSGGAGRDVELLYEKMQDREQFKKLLHTLAGNLAREYDLPGWGDFMETEILKWVFDAGVDRIVGRERTLTDRPLSQEAEKGLWSYMNGPLREQILVERTGNMPRDVTFVFGHTHKPFQEDMNFKHYPEWVNVYNTGGWVVETTEPEPLHGAAVVLVDGNLNVASLRTYNEDSDPAKYSVRVEEASHAGEQGNSFYQRIKGLVSPADDPWRTFSSVLARAVRVRAQNLRARINERD